MKERFSNNRLLETASALALSAVATLGTSAVQPAAAAPQGIYGGGSSLVSLTMRQIFDCYTGRKLPKDGYVFSTDFPKYRRLPASCTIGAQPSVTGLYAGVGSGAGLRGFTGNDPRLLIQSGLPTAPAPLPAADPVYLNGTNKAPFGIYPYPELDFGASDAPLSSVGASSLTTVSFSGFTPSTNWNTLPPTITTVSASGFSTVTYSTAKFGQPVQIPAVEAPVAIAINVAATTAANWTIRSALSPNTQPGGAIQLSAAQICAIFSGQVRDWHSSAPIAALVTSGGVATVTSQRFDADNTNASVHTPLPYTDAALPIRVVYRSDGSGTTFIMTNYLATVCPLLDNGTNNYRKIFTGENRTPGATANLPSTSFSTLVDNIKTVTGKDVTKGPGRWIGASGNLLVAANIGNKSPGSGRIGYVSGDFAQPYYGAGFAPLSASVQNENLRANGVNHPGDKGTFPVAKNFIPPTPDTTNNAWKRLKAPPVTATYNDWNVYNQTFTSGSSGGIPLTGKRVLPLVPDADAYPISGTAFLELYSCYADPKGTRVPAIKNFLSWLIGGGNPALPAGKPSTSTDVSPKYDPNVNAVLANNGFHALPPAFSAALLSRYVKPSTAGGSKQSIAAFKTSGPQVDGCTGVTGGGAN
ncbi:MAG TPA: substrate-binding domain-containing protein [Methylocella sp.]|nr:substrate-binding domain-containing protein [Methylocella sp.]